MPHISHSPPHAWKRGAGRHGAKLFEALGSAFPGWYRPPHAGGGAPSLADTRPSVWRQRLPGVEGQLSLGERASAGATSARQRTIEYGQELSQLQLFVRRDPLTGPTLRLRQPYCFTLCRCSVSWPAWGWRHERASRTHATGGGGGHHHTGRGCMPRWSQRLTADHEVHGSNPAWVAGNRHRGDSNPCGQGPMDF